MIPPDDGRVAPCRNGAKHRRGKPCTPQNHSHEKGTIMLSKSDILTRVTEASTLVSDEHYAAAVETLHKLADSIKAEISLDAAKLGGHLDATKAALRVLKNAANYSRESIKYQWTDKNGRQCFMDGFRAYRLKEALDLPPRPDNAGESVDLDNILKGTMFSAEPLTLPSIGELKATIQTQRAEYRATNKGPMRKPFEPLWRFGDGLPVVNADYLIDTIAIMGEDADVRYSLTKDGKPNCVGMVHFTSNAGEAFLLPIRMASSSQPKPAAKPDPDVQDKLASLNERLNQTRKELTDAEKYQTNFAISCKRCASMYPDTWSISPDEFADYADWSNRADSLRGRIADLEKRIAEVQAA